MRVSNPKHTTKKKNDNKFNDVLKFNKVMRIFTGQEHFRRNIFTKAYAY